MDSLISDSEKLSEKRRLQRDSARTERDFALEERDQARIQRDDFQGQATSLENNSAAQEQFLATVSHDLRNPIGAIKMAVEIIRMNSGKEELEEMTDLIDRSADQAGELINLLLDSHLIKSGEKLPIEMVDCSLWPILRKCHQSLAPQKQSKVILKSEGTTEIWGFWDPLALERAFKNLISNALKFCEDGKMVKITASQGPDITSISVQNFGEIISLENQLRIFETHFRVPNKDLKQKIGWGLGLTLVRGIAEAHSGKIEVSSNRSEGTTFTLRIPNDVRIERDEATG